ncbi:MAG: hypothetical protein ACIAQZ_01860 [Sedimentisphaeraceae bacterium JB056]
MIVLYTKGGLCNRMRAIDSALAVSRKTDHKLLIIWPLDSDLNCRFEELFIPLENTSVINSRLSKTAFKIIQKAFSFLEFIPSLKTINDTQINQMGLNKFRSRICSMVAESRFFLISSMNRLYSEHEKYESMKPNREISERIEKETVKFDAHTIGLHIRRTDNTISIEKSPLSLFENAMEQEIEKDPQANFYIASDCVETKKHLSGKFHGKVITNFSPSSRDSQEGVKQAMTELYALSKTRKVYGSYWSSFSRTAHEITSIEGITLEK